MNRLKFLAGLCLTACLATVPAFAQTDTKAKEPPKPALGPSAAVLEGWLKTRSEPILGRKFDPLQIV